MAMRRVRANDAAGTAPHDGSHAKQRGATILPLSSTELPDDQIHAYVDRLLDSAERKSVESALRRRPLDRIKAAAYSALNVKLKALFAEPPPVMSEALRELMNRTAERFGVVEDESVLARRG